MPARLLLRVPFLVITLAPASAGVCLRPMGWRSLESVVCGPVAPAENGKGRPAIANTISQRDPRSHHHLPASGFSIPSL